MEDFDEEWSEFSTSYSTFLRKPSPLKPGPWGHPNVINTGDSPLPLIKMTGIIS